MNKRGEVASGLTWFFASVVVVLIIFAFFAPFVFYLIGQKGVSSWYETVFGGKKSVFDVKSKVIFGMQRDLDEFGQREVSIGGDFKRMDEIVSSGQDSDRAIFKKEGESFLGSLKNNYPSADFANGWIKVYDSTGKFEGYESDYGQGSCVSAVGIVLDIYYPEIKMEVCLS